MPLGTFTIGLQIFLPEYRNAYAGSWSNTSVVLDRAPDTGLVITPYGAGLTFNPPTLTYAPGQTSAYYFVKASGDIEGEVYNTVSGPYALPDPTYVETSLITSRLT
jgi:hypothetical protein